MSPRRRTPPGELDRVVEAPFIDDAERAEFEWLLERERSPEAPAPSPEIASEYARLDDLLARMPTALAHPDWQDEVLAKAAALDVPWWRRPKLRWPLGGAGVVMAAAAAVWLLVPSPELEIAFAQTGHSRGVGEVAVGDHLVITARPPDGGDLRVFATHGAPVARCPSGPGCTISARGTYRLDVMLDAPGTYHVVLAVGFHGAPAEEILDGYVDAATAGGARVVQRAIVVR
jgi:hypothetical protein